MPREKKYTKTIAFRVTAEEWELIEHGMKRAGHTKSSTWMREVLMTELQALAVSKIKADKLAEAAARRAARKAQVTNVVA